MIEKLSYVLYCADGCQTHFAVRTELERGQYVCRNKDCGRRVRAHFAGGGSRMVKGSSFEFKSEAERRAKELNEEVE